MIVEQIYTGCLAQGAYYIESDGEAAIIDPLREVQAYIDKAKTNGAKIKYVLETHFHADFVSGHVTLADATGAKIIYGPTANPSYEAVIAEDEQVFQLGKVKIKVLHTPGHTLESSCYLLIDENDEPKALFSGDTLFLGDVGRPDLAQKAANTTQEELAGILFNSLRTKIMTLPDDITVYPAHGAGSACGKNMMKITQDSLGNQKAVNYALRADMTKDEFIKEVTDGLLPPPGYFGANVSMNKEGYASIEDVLKSGTKALSPNEFENIAKQTEALILDVRSTQEFAKSHIPGSIFIGLSGSFAPWVGELIIDVKTPILLVVEAGLEQEAVTRLSRVGFDNTLGFLYGGMKSWIQTGREIDKVNSITPQEFEGLYKSGGKHIVDVRKESEYLSEHVIGAENAPLASINKHLNQFSENEDNYVHCAGGYRSMIACSILKSRGYHNVIDVQGGFKAITELSVDTTEYVCPSTLK